MMTVHYNEVWGGTGAQKRSISTSLEGVAGRGSSTREGRLS